MKKVRRARPRLGRPAPLSATTSPSRVNHRYASDGSPIPALEFPFGEELCASDLTMTRIIIRHVAITTSARAVSFAVGGGQLLVDAVAFTVVPGDLGPSICGNPVVSEARLDDPSNGSMSFVPTL
jgi:hypothetical protein